MDIHTDLERVLWHEIGHLCVDILQTEANNHFYIDDFWVSYHKIAISQQKWGGAVKMLPAISFENLIKDDDKTSFAMLGLISGCMFQTIFLREFLKADVNFEDCFCTQDKCAGYGDIRFYLGITSEIRKKHGIKNEFIEFSERDIYNIYDGIITENKKFSASINELVIKNRDIIFEAFQQSENKDEFKFTFKDNGLEKLKKDVHTIMLETSFHKTIISLKDILIEKMNM